MSYFAIEVEDQDYRSIRLDYIGDDSLERYKYMTHDEMHQSADIEDFLRAILLEAGTTMRHLDNQRVGATLVGDDNILVWSILMHKGDEEDEIIWKTWDWTKKDQLYYYKSEKTS